MKHTLLLSIFLFVTFGLGAQSLARKGQAEDLRVFPNPVVEFFKVGNSDRVATIKVTNLLGREVRQFEYALDEKYDISELPRGYYLVQLRDRQNRVLRTHRISKR
ncbi:MAG: T9SS type A sorting domain-containing protein [Bacteroidota bacterium]